MTKTLYDILKANRLLGFEIQAHIINYHKYEANIDSLIRMEIRHKEPFSYDGLHERIRSIITHETY